MEFRNSSVTNNPSVIRTRYLVFIDSLAIIFAFMMSGLLRFESFTTMFEHVVPHWPIIPLAIAMRIGINHWRGLYSRLWRYASVNEGSNILSAASIGSAILILLNFTALPLFGFSPIRSISIFVMDWVLNIGLLMTSRLLVRVGLNWLTGKEKNKMLRMLAPRKRILVAGAGDVGAILTRLIDTHPEMGLQIVGFVDDDETKIGKQLHGYSVLGTRYDIPNIIEKEKIEEVILAMPTVSQAAQAEICKIIETCGLEARVIPTIYDLLSGTLTTDQMRKLRTTDTVYEDSEGGYVNKFVHEYHSDSAETADMPTPYKIEIDPMTHAVAANPIEQTDTNFKNLLVTGGAGFIGSNFVRYMLGKYPEYKIVVYDKLTYAGNMDNLLGLEEKFGERYAFVLGDICDPVAVKNALVEHEIDTILNFAAESHVDRSLMEPDNFLRTNVFGTHVLLEASRSENIKRYHQVSTDEVYGQVLHGSFTEQDPLETRSPYSSSKAAADLLVHAYHVSFGVAATISRGSNNIGPYQYPEKAVPIFLTNALEGKNLPIYGDGLYVRDYQYVLDHCSAIDAVLHKGKLGDVYNVGSNNERTTIELASAILNHLGKPKSLIKLVKDRPGQDRRYSLNTSKLRGLGWAPQWNFEDAITDTMDWYLANEWWWRKIRETDANYQAYYDKQIATRLQEVEEQEKLFVAETAPVLINASTKHNN